MTLSSNSISPGLFWIVYRVVTPCLKIEMVLSLANHCPPPATVGRVIFWPQLFLGLSLWICAVAQRGLIQISMSYMIRPPRKVFSSRKKVPESIRSLATITECGTTNFGECTSFPNPISFARSNKSILAENIDIPRNTVTGAEILARGSEPEIPIYQCNRLCKSRRARVEDFEQSFGEKPSSTSTNDMNLNKARATGNRSYLPINFLDL